MQTKSSIPRARRSAAVLGACLAALVLAGPASAATPPTVTTGGAKSVSFGSATLAGTINPNSSNTSYYFQYGQTKLYGSQTAIADAGAGTKTVTVKLPIAGLAPLTVYHYRLVAVNASGDASKGSDRTLKTTPVPLSLSTTDASPNPVSFGGTVTVQGTLTGTNNANRQVILQMNAFPFAGPFVPVPDANVELTTATGFFSFTVPGVGASTQYRVVTNGNPPVISPVTTENVVVKVTSHVARTKKPGFVRVFGTVTPAEDGAQIGILRITHGHGVLAAGTVLRHHSASESTFSKVLKAKKGEYRVLARVVNQPVNSAYGTPLKIG
jgi:hypothetical protein